jgi:hypothetical protein
MSHFAKVSNGIVTQVIVADIEFFDVFVDSSPGAWIQTSYSTFENQNLNGVAPLRGNYAGVGFTYDAVNDVFIAPNPYPSWTLDNKRWKWVAPKAKPEGDFDWDEAAGDWAPA